MNILQNTIGTHFFFCSVYFGLTFIHGMACVLGYSAVMQLQNQTCSKGTCKTLKAVKA